MTTFETLIADSYTFAQDTLDVINSAVADEVGSFTDCTTTVKTDLEGAWDALDIDAGLDTLTTSLKTVIGTAFDTAASATTDGTTALTESDMKKLANPTLNVANKELNSGLKGIQKEAFNIINDIAKVLKTTIKKDSKTCQNNVKKAIKKGEKTVKKAINNDSSETDENKEALIEALEVFADEMLDIALTTFNSNLF